MIDNTQPQNDRFWTDDAFGLLLFAVGATSSSLLALALTDGPGGAGAATGTAAMGHGLLWIGGAIPVGLMSATCLLMGAAQFLGWIETQRIARHLCGVLAVSLSLSLVLGAFSDSAGGLVGLSTGGALADFTSPSLAAFIGMATLCLSIWGAWLSPAKTSAWEKAQQIERPAVPLQASADGVTTEESAALSFEGAPTAYPGVAVSPYPEDVRSRGEIPDGASVLGTEESPKNEEIRDEQGAGTNEHVAAPAGDEVAVEAQEEDSALHLEANGDAESVDVHLAAIELSSGAEADASDEPEDALSHEEWESADSSELEREVEAVEPGLEEDGESESEELEEAAELEVEEGSEWEEEESEESAEPEEEEELEEEELEEEEEELEEEEDSEWEEEESAELEEEEEEELEEEEPEEEEDAEWEEEESAELEEEEEEELEEEEDSEWEEEELEDAAELEEEAEDVVEPEEALEDAAELEEEQSDAEDESAEMHNEEQGDLFAVEDTADEPEVVLEPQSAAIETEIEVGEAPEVVEGAEVEQTLLMKAADLFLERDRVAVSLLQRQFNIDFEECCVILDQLQEMGLIGPYLGGNRRDILLTRDQWLEHVSEMT